MKSLIYNWRIRLKKISCTLVSGRKIRITVVLLFSAAILVMLSYVAYRDFFIEQNEEWPLQISINDLGYHLTLESFDQRHSIVQGTLRLRFNPLLPPEHYFSGNKFLFSPLEYRDGATYFIAWGLESRATLLFTPEILAQRGVFTESAPAPIKVELEALGQPKLYPFSAYLLVIAAKCAIKSRDANGELRDFRPEHGEEDLTVSQNIPGFYLRRAQFSEVLNAGALPLPAKTTKEKEVLYKEWNQGNTFLLVLYTPLFIRVMTCFLGIVAFLSMVYIIFLRPVDEIPRNAVGYFLALWAVRGVLSGGAGLVLTIVDYGTLLLFALLIVGSTAKLLWPRTS